MALNLTGPQSIKNTFTKTERVISGIYFGIVAALSLAIVLPEPQFILAIFLGDFLRGFLVPSAILIPDNFTILHSIAAGCLWLNRPRFESPCPNP